MYAVHDDQKSSDGCGWYFHKRIIQMSHGTDMSHFLHYLMLVIYLLETLSLLYQSVMIKLHLQPTLSMTVPNEYPMTPERTINLRNFVVPGG